jgi:hypothetical protein
MSRLSDPCIHWEEYVAADWAEDLDLKGAFEGYTPVCVDVIDAGGGALVVRTMGVPAADTTWTVASGDRIECRLMSIDSTSTAARIRVGFSDA